MNESLKKKVLVLNGSPRKGKSSTMSVTNAFLRGMEESGLYESEIIHLSDLNIKPCLGCLSCWGRTEGKCVIRDDDIVKIREKIEQADVFIESYPLYFFGMPGAMKVFTDRMLGMMCTYRGQKPPQGGESFHGIRAPKAGQKFVVISSCAYSETDAVYDSLLKQYDCICGKGNYTAILCPQLKTLVELGASERMNRYMNRFTEAGKMFSLDGRLEEETVKSLSKPPFTENTYKILLDNFWREEKAKGKN